MNISDDELAKLIGELTDNGVFEIWYPKISYSSQKTRYTGDIYIPYMMNDALECYIYLRDAVMTGHPGKKTDEMIIRTSMHREEKRIILLVSENEENKYTIFFKDAQLIKKYYEYGRICHFWEPGNIQWSQLVYIIGTMFDKYAFLGDESCNDEEKRLMGLIEFAPFRYHAPAKKLFEELYDTTRKGAYKMFTLAVKAKDTGYAAAVLMYMLFPMEKLASKLSDMLNQKARYRLYNYIYERTQIAASNYPERDYGEEINSLIVKKRENVDEKLRKLGFCGKYPDYKKDYTYIRVVEEHPFTIMDWEYMEYRQTFLVSEGDRRHCGYNLGFFENSGAVGKVILPDEYKA